MIFRHKGGIAHGPPQAIHRLHRGPESKPEAAPARSSASRVLRVVIGVCLLGFPVWFLAPSVWTITSAQAVVNAQVLTLASPIEGIVTVSAPVVGRLVRRGSLLLEIDSPVVDQRHLDELRTELTTLAERVAALKQHLAKIEALKSDLLISFNNYKDSMVRRVTDELQEARSEAEAADANLRLRIFEQEREQALFRRGFGRPNELKAARFAAEVASKNVARAGAAVARLTHQLESMRGGVFTGPGDSRNDVPYSRQRIHELLVQQLDDETQLQEHKARITQIERRIQNETERVRQRSRYQLLAPVDGIVWRQFVTAGSPVAPQTELVQIVETSTVFIDASLSEKFADYVGLGDNVAVRLIGSNTEVPGTVRYILGEGTTGEGRTWAVKAPSTDAHQVHVIVDFDKRAAGTSEFNQCLVGRRAEVRFPDATRSLFRMRRSRA